MKTLLIVIGLLAASVVQAQQKDMTFFITSAGPGKGADLGGLKGADAHCQALAKAAGAGGTHLARLPQHQRRRAPSTRATGSATARGRTPRARRSRSNVEDLHAEQQDQQADRRSTRRASRSTAAATARTGTTSSPARSPTGARFRSTATRPAATGPSSGDGSAVVGHHDRVGLSDTEAARVVELVASLARLQPGRAARRAAATACSTASRPSSSCRSRGGSSVCSIPAWRSTQATKVLLFGPGHIR